MYYLFLLIIAIPAFFRLVNPWFFSMHDFQHIARLFLLDHALHQGQIYPRWVDLLGFNFGYPLFNFYPPLIYYVAEFFRVFGATYIWSIKLMIMVGYIVGALGMYWLGLRLMRSKAAGLVSAVLYTFFTYHAVLVYVRGAFAEFFAMTILPFVFLSLYHLREKPNSSRAIFFAISFAALILAHPLIAFPSLIFIGLFCVYLLFSNNQNRFSFVQWSIVGGFLGLCVSAFFWLPSIIERQYTLIDAVLTKDLASYAIHFVYPDQLWFSPWGYGGSGPGYADGMSFQLGKIHILVAVLSIVLSFLVWKIKSIQKERNDFLAFVFLCVISVFMCIPASKFVWDHVQFLWYLQFPWRFLTFVGVFMPILGAYGVYFFTQLIPLEHKNIASILVVFIISLITIGTYQKYFKPNELIKKSDAQLTSFDEIAWRVSYSSFEFSPRGIPFTLSQYGNHVFDIGENDIQRSSYEVLNGTATVSQTKNFYAEKVFQTQSQSPLSFQLNTFYFPGWAAYIDGVKTTISNENRYRLIMVTIPSGSHTVRFIFEDTPVRKFADIISIISILGIFGYFLQGLYKSKKVKA